MAKKDKEKKISITTFERIVKENEVPTVTEQWFDTEIVITPTLPLVEMLQFVSEVVDVCFLEDGTYVPELMDFAIKSGILTHYANFTLPQDSKKQYWMIYSSDAVEMVMPHINNVQFEEIVGAIRRKVAHMLSADVQNMRAQLSTLIQAFSEMSDNLSGMFDGVSKEDIERVMGAVGDGGIDEKKLVEAYLDQTVRAPGDVEE